MELKEFTQKVCSAIKKEFGEACQVEMREVCKNNGVVLHGLLIVSEERNVIPTIYLDSFWEAHENGVTFAEIIRRLVEIYSVETCSKSINLEFFKDFGKVKDRICYRLIGKRENETLLEDIPHIDFLDLAICFFYAYQGEELGEGSILIHNSHVNMWKTSVAELLMLAEKNTPYIFPGHIYSMEEAMENLLKEKEAFPNGADDSRELLRRMPMKVLSNRQKSHGAACILYKEMLEKTAEACGESFYVIPSSIHEVIVVPCTGAQSVESMKKMICEVNRTQIPSEEVLSDSLYFYDFQEKRLEIIS